MSPKIFALIRFAVPVVLTLTSFGRGWSTDLIGDYRLQEASLDNFYAGPGALGSLTVTESGGTSGFGPTGWSWSDAVSPGSGLNLAGLPLDVTAEYSIGITAMFGETSGFRKMIDFKDQTTDTGFYIHNQQFQFYNSTEGAGSVADFQTFTIILTRDAAKSVNVYLNGDATPILSFVDTDDLAVASQNVLKFFQDDTAISGEFSSMGVANLIRVWNGALASSEIAGAMTVPEPSTWLMGVAGMTALAAIARKRARRNG